MVAVKGRDSRGPARLHINADMFCSSRPPRTDRRMPTAECRVLQYTKRADVDILPNDVRRCGRKCVRVCTPMYSSMYECLN